MAGPAATDNMQTSQIICKWMQGEGGTGVLVVGGWLAGRAKSGATEVEGGGGGVNPFQVHFSPRRKGRSCTGGDAATCPAERLIC